MIKDLLKRQEGFSRFPYNDVGDTSIGYGRNLSQVGLSEEEAEHLLNNDIERVKKELTKFDFYEELNETRKIALISMGYNLGITRLSRFTKMLNFLETKQYKKAALEIYPNSLYAQQVPSRAFEISELICWGNDATSTFKSE
jgi:lysozyme